MISSLLYIFLGLGVIILLYKLQYNRQEKKGRKENIKIKNNIIVKNNIKKNVKQNLNTKYNVGTYRDTKGRFRSLKTLTND